MYLQSIWLVPVRRKIQEKLLIFSSLQGVHYLDTGHGVLDCLKSGFGS